MKYDVIEACEPIFDTKTYIIIGWPKKEVISFLLEKFKYNVESDLEDIDGCAWDFRFNQVFWVRKKNDYSTIAHEAGHVVFNILQEVQAFPENSNQCETFLRMQEYLINAALQK